MNTIIYTIICALVISFVLGALLGLFKKIFHVDTDPNVEKVREVLSGANCGGCGLAGCDAFAGAVVKGDAEVNGCIAGGSDCTDKISKILNKAGVELKPQIAVLACQGSKECAVDKAAYKGIQTCAGAQLVMNGTKKCAFGCIGLGDCIKVCPFGALSMGENGLPVVDKNKCIGCGKCNKACPKKLFRIIDADTKGPIGLCSSKSDNKPQIKKDCAKGCLKCGSCARKCPSGALELKNGLPVVDYSKCTSCGECVTACPDKVFVLL